VFKFGKVSDLRCLSMLKDVEGLQVTVTACRRPSNLMTLSAEPHNKYIFI